MASFDLLTRRKLARLSAATLTGGQSNQWQLPRTGLLAEMWLSIRATISTSDTVTDANPLGCSAIIRRVRLTSNSAIDIFSVSGANAHYLLNDFLDTEQVNIVGQNQGSDTLVVSNGTVKNLDMLIPVTLNSRDPLGLIMLQNEQTLLTLTIEVEAVASLGTNISGVSVTVQPIMVFFTVPADNKAIPPLNVIHQITDQSMSVSGTGDINFEPPRGNTYVQINHGLGMGVSGADNWSRLRVQANQSDTWSDHNPASLDFEYYRIHGRARKAGVLPIDFIGSTGLGNFGSGRDLFNSALVTDFLTIITPTTTGTLYTLRRQLVPLNP